MPNLGTAKSSSGPPSSSGSGGSSSSSSYIVSLYPISYVADNEMEVTVVNDSPSQSVTVTGIVSDGATAEVVTPAPPVVIPAGSSQVFNCTDTGDLRGVDFTVSFTEIPDMLNTWPVA